MDANVVDQTVGDQGNVLMLRIEQLPHCDRRGTLLPQEPEVIIFLGRDQILEPAEVPRLFSLLLFTQICARVPVRPDVEYGHWHYDVQQHQPRLALRGERDGMVQCIQGRRPEICGE